ncbi:hypothetical protein TSAR_014126, partial [Trichomalopsis sarcophagae]
MKYRLANINFDDMWTVLAQLWPRVGMPTLVHRYWASIDPTTGPMLLLVLLAPRLFVELAKFLRAKEEALRQTSSYLDDRPVQFNNACSVRATAEFSRYYLTVQLRSQRQTGVVLHPILFLKKRYVTSNVDNNAVKQKTRKSCFVTRGFLGSLNTNIATPTLCKVPGVQGGQYQRRLLELGIFEVAEHEYSNDNNNNGFLGTWCLGYTVSTTSPGIILREDVILSTLSIRYFGERRRHDIRVLRPQKHPRDDVILYILGTRYLGKRRRHDIRVLRPQKPR